MADVDSGKRGLQTMGAAADEDGGRTMMANENGGGKYGRQCRIAGR